MSQNVSPQAAIAREQARSSDGKFGAQPHDKADGVDLEAPTETLQERAERLEQEYRVISERYREVAVASNEAQIELLSERAAELTDENTVSLAVTMWSDDPENRCESARGISLVKADGSLEEVEWGDDCEELSETWQATVDRQVLWDEHRGLIEPDETDWDHEVNDVFVYIPIKGRDHGLEDPWGK